MSDEADFRRRAEARRIALALDASGGAGRARREGGAAEVALGVLQRAGVALARGAGARRAVGARFDAGADALARAGAAAEVTGRVLERSELTDGAGQVPVALFPVTSTPVPTVGFWQAVTPQTTVVVPVVLPTGQAPPSGSGPSVQNS